MRRIRLFLPCLIVLLGVPPMASGQAVMHFSETADQEVLAITLHPAAEPSPALKYRLLPTMPEQTPGNAAVHYGKVTAEQIPLFSDKDLWNKIAEWTYAPLEELRRDKVLKQLQRRFDYVYDTLERAGLCKTCDWQLPFHEGNPIAILLSEAQHTRQFARFLAARARAEIAEGKYDEAIHTLRIGYAMARHIAEGETLVNGLVGIAIFNIMSRQMRDLIQQPDAPNLYWALTSLPRPMIDMRRAAEAEMHLVAWTFPELLDAEDSNQDAEYWRKALLDFWEKFSRWDNFDGPPDASVAVTTLCLRGYPMAKRNLIEQGMDPERVEAMPVGQVVAIHAIRTYNDLRDDTFKSFYVSFSDGYRLADQADQRLMRYEREGREVIPLAGILLPAVRACRSAVARCDREIALLRIVEALRLHGAAHEGQLPETLDDVTLVPIPLDPYTGRPFKYTRKGDTALVEPIENSDGWDPNPPGLILRLEIRFAK